MDIVCYKNLRLILRNFPDIIYANIIVI